MNTEFEKELEVKQRRADFKYWCEDVFSTFMVLMLFLIVIIMPLILLTIYFKLIMLVMILPYYLVIAAILIKETD